MKVRQGGDKRVKQWAGPMQLMNHQHEMMDRFPALPTAAGNLVHVYEEDGEWHVWLNTESTEFDGLCLAVEKDKADAIREGINALRLAADLLARWPAPEEPFEP